LRCIAKYKPFPTRQFREAERAKAKGTQFGRPQALDAGQKRVIGERYASAKTIVELAADYECGVGTIWRALNGRPFEASVGL
jgi:DNA invertase Pin-like site-specific DNA recombinase